MHTITNDSAENKWRKGDDEPIFSQLVSVCIDDAHPGKKDVEIVCWRIDNRKDLTNKNKTEAVA